MNNNKYHNDKSSLRPFGGQQINQSNGQQQNQMISQPVGAQLKSLDGKASQLQVQMKLSNHKQQVVQYFGAQQTRQNRGKPGQYAGNARIKQGLVQNLTKPQSRKPHQPPLHQQEIDGLHFVQNQPNQRVPSKSPNQFNDPAPTLCDRLPSQTAITHHDLPNQLHLPHHGAPTTIINNNNINFYAATPGQVNQHVPIFPQNHGAIIEIITQGQSSHSGAAHHQQHQLVPMRSSSGLMQSIVEDKQQSISQKNAQNSLGFLTQGQQRKNTNNPKGAGQAKQRSSGLRAGSQSQIGNNAKMRGQAPGQQRQRPAQSSENSLGALPPADPSHQLAPSQGPPATSNKKRRIPVESQIYNHAGDGHLAQSMNTQQHLSHQSQYGTNQMTNDVPHQSQYMHNSQIKSNNWMQSSNQMQGFGAQLSNAARGQQPNHAASFGSIAQMIYGQQNRAARRPGGGSRSNLHVIGSRNRSHQTTNGSKAADFAASVPEQDESLLRDHDSQGSHNFGSSIDRVDLHNETASFKAPSHHHHRQLKSAKKSYQQLQRVGGPSMSSKQSQLEPGALPGRDYQAADHDSRILKPKIGSGYQVRLGAVQPQFGQIHSQSMYELPSAPDMDELAQQERLQESVVDLIAQKNSNPAEKGEDNDDQRQRRTNSGYLGQTSQTPVVDGNGKRLFVKRQDVKPAENKTRQLQLRPNIQINKRPAAQVNGAHLYLGDQAAAQAEQVHAQSMAVNGAQNQRMMRDSRIGSLNARNATGSKQRAGLNLQISIKEQSPRLEGREATGPKPRQDAATFHQGVWAGNAQQRDDYANEKALRQSRLSSLTRNSEPSIADRGQLLGNQSRSYGARSKLARLSTNGQEIADALEQQRENEIREQEMVSSDFERPYINHHQEQPRDQIFRGRQSSADGPNSKPTKVLNLNLPINALKQKTNGTQQTRLAKGGRLTGHYQSHQELLLPHAAEKLEHDSYDQLRPRIPVTSLEASPVRQSARRLVPMKQESFEQLAIGISRGGLVGPEAAHHGKRGESRDKMFVITPNQAYAGHLKSARSQGVHQEPDEYGCYGPSQRLIPAQPDQSVIQSVTANSASKARQESCEDSARLQGSDHITMVRQAAKRPRALDNDQDVSHLKASEERAQLDPVLAPADYRYGEDPDELERPRPESKPTTQGHFEILRDFIEEIDTRSIWPREESRDIEEIEHEILNMEYAEPDAPSLEYQRYAHEILDNRQIVQQQQLASRHPSNEGLAKGVRVHERANGQELSGLTDARWLLESAQTLDDVRSVQAIGLNKDLEKTQRIFWSRQFKDDE